MMLAFFWSVADCNRHGCAVWDALCKYPNHKKTHTKENKKEGNKTQETCSINVFVIKKEINSNKKNMVTEA